MFYWLNTLQQIQEENKIFETKLQNYKLSSSKWDNDYFSKKYKTPFLGNKILKRKAIKT